MEEIHAVCRQINASDQKLIPPKAETEKSENLFLYIDLPRFDFPVIFSEPVRCEWFLVKYNNNHLRRKPATNQSYPQ
jgi:hypothetical protein